MTDKLLKARLIIAKLLASKIFVEWENRTRDDIISMLYKYDEELSLGINPAGVFNTMTEHQIIYPGPFYEDNQYYSLCSNKSENLDNKVSKSFPSNTTITNSSILPTQTNLM